MSELIQSSSLGHRPSIMALEIYMEIDAKETNDDDDDDDGIR